MFGIKSDEQIKASQSHEFWSGVRMYAGKASCIMDKEALSFLSSSRLAAIESRFPQLKGEINGEKNT